MYKRLRVLTVIFAVLTFVLFLIAIWAPEGEQDKLTDTAFLFLITSLFCSFGFIEYG